MLQKTKILLEKLNLKLESLKTKANVTYTKSLISIYNVYQKLVRVAQVIASVYRFAKKVTGFVTKTILILGLILAGLNLMVKSLPRSSKYVKKGLTPYGTFSPAEQVVKGVDPIISLFVTNELGERHFQCTAFVIDAQYALTAGHCVFDDKGPNVLEKIDAKVAGYPNHFPVEAVAYNMRTDVGLIRGDFRGFPVVDIDFTSFDFTRIKTQYMSCGHPGGQNLVSCSPFVLAYQDLFLLTGIGAVIPGMSGGPLIDLKTSKAVGILSRATDGRRGLVQMAPIVGALGSLGIDPTK